MGTIGRRFFGGGGAGGTDPDSVVCKSCGSTLNTLMKPISISILDVVRSSAEETGTVLDGGTTVPADESTAELV